MGKILKTERSLDDAFQFTLWDNGDNKVVIEIRRFRRMNNGKRIFAFFDKMTFTPVEFENFKKWISTFKG